jgi:predicted transposase/invertase (TIGR01784 family)
MTTGFLHNPHDKLFKLSMEQPLVAQEFFARHLPPDLLKRLDLTTLHSETNSFVDDIYKATAADLVYSLKLDDATAYFYLLFEQQSEVAQDMAFRLQVYKLRIIENHRKQHPDDPLPVVFPLVLYTGEDPWTAPREIFPLFGDQEALARSLWDQPYVLIDVCRIQDNDLLQDQLSGLVQYVYKYRKNQRDFKQFIETVIAKAEEIEKVYPMATQLIGAVIRYIIDGIQEPGNDADRALLIQKAQASSSTTVRGDIMTFAQQFEQIGVAKGIQQGEVAVLKRLLTRRFGSLDSSCLEQLEKANPEQLLVWVDRVLEAKTLPEVFKN